MATTQSRTGVVGAERKKELVREYERRVLWIFKVRSEEVVKSETLGNDIHVDTDRPISRVFVNGREYKEA